MYIQQMYTVRPQNSHFDHFQPRLDLGGSFWYASTLMYTDMAKKMGLAGSPKEVNPLETHTRGGLVLATLSTEKENPSDIYG